MGSERSPETKSQDLTSRIRNTWPKVVIIVFNWNGWKDTVERSKALGELWYVERLRRSQRCRRKGKMELS